MGYIKIPKVYTYRDAIDEVKSAASRLKHKGFEIKIDEMDFESNYQIVIKIDKNKQKVESSTFFSEMVH